MKTKFNFTLTMIKCPACDTVQAAIVEHTVPFGTFIHNCENQKCQYIIMESEWQVVEPFIMKPTSFIKGKSAKHFFNQMSVTDANDAPIDKYAQSYTRADLCRFAEAYHKSEMNKKNIKSIRHK